MAFKKKYIHVIMVLLIGYFVCACRQADEISGEQWAKGYNLPVEEQEAKEAENDDFVKQYFSGRDSVRIHKRSTRSLKAMYR